MSTDCTVKENTLLSTNPFIVAIDGHSSCGKSTLAKDLATHFNLSYIDTGAMYRAVAYYMILHQIGLNEIKDHLDHITISFTSAKEGNHLLLNGIVREDEIRSPEVNQVVSEVAEINEVRVFLVAQQRQMGQKKNVILDGRDIGTVVYPNAEVKLFVTASAEVRAMRRYLEYQSKGTQISLKEIEDNLNHRDTVDSTREHSPLKQAEDASVIDNSSMTKQEQLNTAIGIVLNKINFAK